MDDVEPGLQIKRHVAGGDSSRHAQVTYYDELPNEKGLCVNTDLLEEKRVATVDKMAKYKGKVTSYYNKKVWIRVGGIKGQMGLERRPRRRQLLQGRLRPTCLGQPGWPSPLFG
ncbi:hypothetical protein LIER_31924 [Lithospermum erythrorhizon]|uniref:Uncharacterized protein n=1 Tax=Lithospermum erythrorhizon TaxID=34254 RepID=A0AAV3RXR6_LITER